MIQNKLFRRLLSEFELWIENTIHDQSIGYVEAAEYVIAKMHNEAAQTKRQTCDYDRTTGKFSITTHYTIQHAGSVEHKHLTGTPHVEVQAYGAVQIGCITFNRETIAKVYQLSQQEPGWFHNGYMVKKGATPTK